MPSQYAHYRFGAAVLGELPADLRRPIQRFRQLYDVGLHGPDIFFYHNIFIKDAAGKLGSKFHQQTGQEFFTRACKRLRLSPNEAARVYLYGILAHYCLDSVCHPFVKEQANQGKIGHVEMETEFDRYLLFQDGKRPPHAFDHSRHMKLTRGECVTAAEVFSPATPAMVSLSIRNMAAVKKLLASPRGIGRATLDTAVKLVGDKFAQHVMHRTPNKNCAHLNEPLEDLYEEALEKYPRMLEQLVAHLDHGAPLTGDFEKTFG